MLVLRSIRNKWRAAPLLLLAVVVVVVAAAVVAAEEDPTGGHPSEGSSSSSSSSLRSNRGRGFSLTDSFPAESSCNDVKDEASCYQAKDGESGQPCEWCVAGAIPSECMSEAQAQELPEGVFQCKAPGFLAGNSKLYTVNAVERDSSDLCDSSSKSISGYMDVKGKRTVE